MSLDERRQRIAPLRKRHTVTQAELQALETATADQQRYLRLVEKPGAVSSALARQGRVVTW